LSNGPEILIIDKLTDLTKPPYLYCNTRMHRAFNYRKLSILSNLSKINKKPCNLAGAGFLLHRLTVLAKS